MDTGADLSIITITLSKKLGLKISKVKEIGVTTVDQVKREVMGRVEVAPFTIQNVKISINLRIIKSIEEKVLLGMD